jgi:xyloglucan-specific exo-beta-1,4-glucanase
VLSSDGSLYVTYANHCGPNGLTDGAVWKLNSKSGEWTDITPVKPSADDKFGYAGVSVDQQHPQTLIVSTLDRWAKQDDIFRSTDGGKTWKSYRESVASRDVSHAPYMKDDVKSHTFGHWIGDCEIDPFDADHLLYVTGWGVWSSRDATALDRGEKTNWSFSSQGIEEVVANDVVSPPVEGGAPVLSVIWDLDGFRHDRLDASPSLGYFRPQVGRNTSIDFAQKQPNFCVRVFGGENSHGAYSTDNGRTWTAFKSAPGEKLADGFVAVSAEGSTICWTPENGIAFVSRDRGETWTACAGVPPKVRVASDREDDKRFYACDGATGAIYVSTDGGATFKAAPVTIAKSENWLAAMPDKPGEFFVATDTMGLYRTTDAGQSFTRCPGVDKAHRVGFGKAAPGHDEPAVYITGHVNGVYGFWRSDDAGRTWLRINDDQHQFGTINAITGDMRVFGRVYLASANRGVLYGEPK